MRSKKSLWAYVIVPLLVAVLLDRLTKWWVQSAMVQGQSIPILPGIFHLTFTTNSGAAFSILSGKNTFLIALSSLVILFIIYSYIKLPPSKWTSLSVGFILGGAVSNLLDRFTRGGIVDFLDFRIFPVFNAADMCISLGVLGLVYYFIKTDYLDKRKKK